jgi:hypothetical protein
MHSLDFRVRESRCSLHLSSKHWAWVSDIERERSDDDHPIASKVS